jgi:hypothetical protein
MGAQEGVMGWDEQPKELITLAIEQELGVVGADDFADRIIAILRSGHYVIVPEASAPIEAILTL